MTGAPFSQSPVEDKHRPPDRVRLVKLQVPLARSHFGALSVHPPETSRQLGVPQSESALHLGAWQRPLELSQLPPGTVRMALPHTPLEVSHFGVVSVQLPAEARQLTLPQSGSARHWGGTTHSPVAAHTPPATVRCELPHTPVEVLHRGTLSMQLPPAALQLGLPQSASALHFGG